MNIHSIMDTDVVKVVYKLGLDWYTLITYSNIRWIKSIRMLSRPFWLGMHFPSEIEHAGQIPSMPKQTRHTVLKWFASAALKTIRNTDKTKGSPKKRGRLVTRTKTGPRCLGVCSWTASLELTPATPPCNRYSRRSELSYLFCSNSRSLTSVLVYARAVEWIRIRETRTCSRARSKSSLGSTMLLSFGICSNTGGIVYTAV
ncbi:hypothetical protein F4679DRAFT_564522 [Xylaria curta]|nr:hypothetical protein F4679DRAFT_564522 [Xylaria curta]